MAAQQVKRKRNEEAVMMVMEAADCSYEKAQEVCVCARACVHPMQTPDFGPSPACTLLADLAHAVLFETSWLLQSHLDLLVLHFIPASLCAEKVSVDAKYLSLSKLGATVGAAKTSLMDEPCLAHIPTRQ